MVLTMSVTEDGIKIITLKGRLDIAGTQQIDTRLTVAIATESANTIIDLSGVEFISSLGIGIMVRAANSLLKHQGKIVFLNPQPNVAKVLTSTRIIEVIPIMTNLESALSYLKIKSDS
jgi:anti-sigma B factor antagonist